MLEQQAGLDPDPAADRNQQVRADAVDDSAGGLRWSVRQLGAPGRSLIARYDRLLDGHPPVRLGTVASATWARGAWASSGRLFTWVAAGLPGCQS